MSTIQSERMAWAHCIAHHSWGLLASMYCAVRQEAHRLPNVHYQGVCAVSTCVAEGYAIDVLGRESIVGRW